MTITKHFRGLAGLLISVSFILSTFFLVSCSSDDSSSPTVTVSAASIVEGDSGTTDLVFTVTASDAAGANASVSYSTSDGTAVAGLDYTAASGSVSVAQGSQSATITISVLTDTDLEEDETFTLTLTSASGLDLGSNKSATGTITNDDDANPKGYFSGAATVNTDIEILDMIGLAYENRLLMFSKTGASNVFYDLRLTTITVTSYTGTVYVYEDGTITQSVDVTGTTNDSQITGTFSGTGLASGSFNILYDTNNNTGATLARIETSPGNNWTGFIYGVDGDSPDSGAFASSDLGAYTGIDNTNEQCSYPGTHAIPDPQLNIYPLSHDVIDSGLTVTCLAPYASTGHTGFAAVIDDVNPDDTLVYGFSNGSIALFAVMTH